LISLVDLSNTWLGFSLREDLIAGLKVGEQFAVNIPALGNREVTAEVRVIAAKGEYAGWRATRATGDFDLRTFAIRAYPVDKIDGLRPGMSVYTDWTKRPQWNRRRVRGWGWSRCARSGFFGAIVAAIW
jgi:HlyD family secretion protein